jgi:hypothetical protein
MPPSPVVFGATLDAKEIAPSLAGLVEWGACLAGSPLKETARLAGILLETRQDVLWRSSLNNDGSPLQVCISLPTRIARPAVRLIADPAANSEDWQTKWNRSREVMSAVIESHAPQLNSLCNSVLEHILPTEPTIRAALTSGLAWLAVDLTGRGMALYATTRWGDSTQRWTRTRRWLQEVLPASSAAEEVLDRLTTNALLVSAGIEGATAGNARAKLYWRLRETASLHDLGIPLFKSAALHEFLHDVIENRRIPRTGIVGSISFNVASGCVHDVKLDICGHCVRRTSADWMNVIERTIARNELQPFPVECQLWPDTTELAFIGFGVDAKLSPRLNIYFKRTSP